MDEDRQAGGRSGLFDSTSPNRLMNELLLTILIPAAIVFTGTWAIFRLYFDELLLALGLGRVTPHPLPFIAIESGYGRAFLAMVLSAFIVLMYLAVYANFLRQPLKERELV